MMDHRINDERCFAVKVDLTSGGEAAERPSLSGEQDAATRDMTAKRRRKRGPMSLARKRRWMDTIEARRIQSFISEFDVDRAETGILVRAEDTPYMAAEQRYYFPPTADERSGHWLNLKKDLESRLRRRKSLELWLMLIFKVEPF